jgi:plasmid stability protein
MANLTIRNLDDSVKLRLRVQAAQHGRSMEEEARTILSAALPERPSRTEGLGTAIRRRFAPLGGMELDLPPREKMPGPPSFD